MKPYEDRGGYLEITKPLKIGRRVYDKAKPPPPSDMPLCLAMFNDAGSNGPAELWFSDGSSWHQFQYVGRAGAAASVPTIDVDAIASEVINRAIQQMPQPAMKVIAPPADPGGQDLSALAQGILETSDHVAALANQYAQEMAELRQRVEFVEQHALARAEIKSA